MATQREFELEQALRKLLAACTEIVKDRFGDGYDAEYTHRPDWPAIEAARAVLEKTA